MSEREDAGSLAARVAALSSERARLLGEVEAARRELADWQASRDERRKARVAARRRGPMLAIFVLVGLGVAVIAGLVVLRLVEAETLYGHVTARIGEAPALADDRCVLRVEPAYLPYNGWIQLDCGRRRLYGYDSYGHLQCETRDGRASRCEDSGPIEVDGDPHLVVDRAAGRVQVDDGDRWRLEIALDGRR